MSHYSDTYLRGSRFIKKQYYIYYIKWHYKFIKCEVPLSLLYSDDRKYLIDQHWKIETKIINAENWQEKVELEMAYS